MRRLARHFVNGLVTVPAELVGELRRGLRTIVGDAADAMLQASELAGEAQRRESYAAPRELLGEACALLDQIGWEDPPGASAVHIDLRRHHRMLSAALRAALRVAEDEQADARALGSRRADDGKAPAQGAHPHLRAMREYTAAIEDLRVRLAGSEQA